MQRKKSFLIRDILGDPRSLSPQPPLCHPFVNPYYSFSALTDSQFSLYCAGNCVPPVDRDPHSTDRKVRRNRTVFTELQLMGLERRFDSQKYLSTPDRAELARALGLTQLQVKTWYQNRRMKWKKQVMSGGCAVAPTKPKGRPKKNSIPSFGLLDTQALLAIGVPLHQQF